MSTVWQVGGGMSGSPYDKLLIKYDLALLGTGESFQPKDNMLEGLQSGEFRRSQLR